MPLPGRIHFTALVLIAVLAPIFALKCVAQDEEVSLFDSDGKPVAYVSMGEDVATIYMWSGKPVAYLKSSRGTGFSIYGFNGKHLGWFVKGILRDHDGDAACEVRDVVTSPELEPLKSLKQLKPLKAIPEIEPIRPIFTLEWSSTPCGLFLMEGAER